MQLVFDALAGAAALVALIIAYRRHKSAEFVAARNRVEAQLEHARLYHEPFAAAAAQIGDETAAARLAGVRAMAGLADDWPEHRQACVDVLCAYLRTPCSPAPVLDLSPGDRPRRDAAREVRDTVFGIITAHLRPSAEVSWRSLNLDFTGVVFDRGDFSGVGFSGGQVSFGGAKFPSGQVSFAGAEFSGGGVSFAGAELSGAEVSFARAGFSGGQVEFRRARFSGSEVGFRGARFTGGEISFGRTQSGDVGAGLGYAGFSGAEFSGGQLSFKDAEFSGGRVDFRSARFSGTRVSFILSRFNGSQVGFRLAKFSGGEASFNGAKFTGGPVDFGNARFSGGLVDFFAAEFSGGLVGFDGAHFTSEVSFLLAKFSGGEVDFSKVADWSYRPQFDGGGLQPSGVRLPGGSDASELCRGPSRAGA